MTALGANRNRRNRNGQAQHNGQPAEQAHRVAATTTDADLTEGDDEAKDGEATQPVPPQRVRMPIPPPTYAQTNGEGIESPFGNLDKEEIPPGLPPALDGFLVLLLQVAHIDAPNYAVLNKQDLSLAQKVMVFKSGIALLRRVYGEIEPYPATAPKINSISRYLDLTEPTRGHSGSLSGDFQRLWYFVDKLKTDPDRVPRAYGVNTPNKGTGDFSSELDNYQAQAYRYEMASHMRRILASTALQASGGTTLSLMESVFKATGTFLVNTLSN